jgi:hypothetical protein
MNAEPLLKDKVILFVDDRYEITRDYMRRAEERGAQPMYCNTIDKAYALLERVRSGMRLDFCVLDLHMRLPDPLPDGLLEFGAVFQQSPAAEKRSLNAGQILGMYINRYLEKVQFIYLSAVAAHYEKLAGGEPEGEPKCFDRYETSATQLAEEITRRLVTTKGNEEAS